MAESGLDRRHLGLSESQTPKEERRGATRLGKTIRGMHALSALGSFAPHMIGNPPLPFSAAVQGGNSARARAPGWAADGSSRCLGRTRACLGSGLTTKAA